MDRPATPLLPRADIVSGPPATAAESPSRSAARFLGPVLACGAAYYAATQLAWLLCFPDTHVSLFFPPHALLVSILLLTPARQWWAFVLAAMAGHFVATRQAGWPPGYALHCEAFDAAKALLAAGGLRLFVRSPFDRLTLREAVLFVVIAAGVVPFGTAFWGAALTLAHGAGDAFWIEWRNLGISNGVTTIIVVPAVLLGVRALAGRRVVVAPARMAEALLLAGGLCAVGYAAFHRLPGAEASTALLYAPVPLLVWATLRFGLGGMSASMLLLAALAIRGTMQGQGPFLAQSPAENALDLQLFLMMIAVPLMLLAVAIGEERRSKESLRLSEARMSLAAASAQLVLWDWDIAKDRAWTTDEGRATFGLGPDETIDYATLSDRIHPDDRAARDAAIRRALLSGEDYEAEFRLLMPDGSVRWIAARGRVAGGDAARTRMLGVSMEITRAKRAAAEAQVQRDELAHLSRAATLSTLSGSMAHDLMQPLTSILSNADAGLRYLAMQPPDLGEVREILKDIISEDRRAGDMIGRMRTMLKRGEVALRPVDVDECIAELLRLLRTDIAARHVAVTPPAAGERPLVLTDRVQLQQVLHNLIVNACDAMQGVPSAQRVLTLTTDVVGGEMHIGVLDAGVGLPDDVESLFRPFHSTKPHGLGMGLSICRSLVGAHRGRLWAEPRPGGGAAFRIALPLA